jgi:hypothetical protein
MANFTIDWASLGWYHDGDVHQMHGYWYRVDGRHWKP